MSLAILDWGIGGIDFHARVRARHPDVPMIYWSDSGATPYGKLSREALAARVATVAAALRQRGASRLVIACNAASTVLDHPAVAGAGLPVSGVIGGRRTIRSGLYRRALLAAGRRVCQRVAQPLSAMVERGELAGPAVALELDRILAPLRRIDALVLACTHYTALLAPVRERLPGVRIIDPAAATLAEVERRGWLSGHGGSDMFLTTGSPTATREAAHLAFGARLPEFQRLPL